MSHQLIHADCLNHMRGMPDASVDLVIGSPPYEAARTYGVGFKLRGQEWVDWCKPRFIECCRVSRGVVAWVVEGQTRKFRYSAAPLLLMADLHRAGVNLRKPPLYVRDGIPGSGGPDWLKNKYEFIICATPPGKLIYSDNTAMGHPPLFGPGGAPSHRRADGTRVNLRLGGMRRANGKRRLHGYTVPALANPGNLISCGPGGGGHMGDDLAHESEAPFPEYLVEFFVRSFCPVGGTLLDPFCGSGTSLVVAKRLGRNAIGIDIRDGKGGLDTARRRLASVQLELREGA